jgi:hypothetical protein
LTLPYKEGTWFAVPLQSGEYAVGRVARHAPKGLIVLAYLFGPKRQIIPTLADVAGLRPEQALRIWRVGDLALVEGNWPILGDSATWDRDDWPVPNFIRKPDFSRVAWRVVYSDDNPNEVVGEERIPADTTGLDRDSLHGAKATEIALKKILA